MFWPLTYILLLQECPVLPTVCFPFFISICVLLFQVSSALRVILAPGNAIRFNEMTLARADWARYFRDAAGLADASIENVWML